MAISAETLWNSFCANPAIGEEPIRICNLCTCMLRKKSKLKPQLILLNRFLADRFVEGECPFCSYEVGGNRCCIAYL